ncbi:2-phosphosulfolactate phosphatase [Gorillibacterium sp. sgz5001074]|uniref:2-phosphosulfolactate phosphatase n=1 Tax=Gorillibacterium sp. sgz5001074 TaxID=3446695 RepID=UPI003F66EB50
MQIEVIASVIEARSEDLAGKTVLVIDVLRATSNMVTGLAHGCPGIVPVETVQQAKSLHAPGDLLGGERNCRKLAGFDLGNSPFEYMGEEVAGKRILMTTTNGTRAIQKAQRAQTVIACSLLNVTACAEAALAIGRDVTVLCSGTQDVFSLEDGLCAGMLVEELQRLSGGVEIGDFGLAMQACYLQNRNRLTEALLTCSNGNRLIRLGFKPDIEYCARTNVYDVVPVLRDGMLVPAGVAAKP